jgi:hypothetical protein
MSHIDSLIGGITVASTTFTLNVLVGELFTGDQPDHVTVDVTPGDVSRWLSLAAFMKENGIAEMLIDEERCTFFFGGEALGNIAHSLDFNPDFMKTRIKHDGIEFCGELRHSGEAWFTDTLPLDALAGAFGLTTGTEQATKPSVVITVSGGVVTDVESDEPMSVTINDLDVGGESEQYANYLAWIQDAERTLDDLVGSGFRREINADERLDDGEALRLLDAVQQRIKSLR